MKSFIPLLVIFSVTSHAVCEWTELHELFEVPFRARREALYRRKEAPENTFPFYVSLRRKKEGGHFCAGTLISPHYVLTSASCIDHEEERRFVREVIVDIGTYSQDRPENNVKRAKSAMWRYYNPEYGMQVEHVIPHEKYSNGKGGGLPYDAKYDIALMKLKKASKLCWALLPLATSDCCGHGDYLNVGLGRKKSDFSAYARTLEMAAFPYMPHTQCAAYFAMTKFQNDFFGTGSDGNVTEGASFCVSGEGQYCQLDRGSALMRYTGPRGDYTALGLTNRATGQRSYGAPYVFSSIAFHVGWILDQGVGKEISQVSERAATCKLEYERKALVGKSENADPGDYPFAVSIRLTKSMQEHRCHGVLISPKHVITAASCIPARAYNASREITAYIGGLHINPRLDSTVNKGNEKELIGASEIIIHPKYRAKRNAVNLAIVVLKEKSKKSPVLLPVPNRTSCADGTNVRLFGWGATEPEGSPVTRLQVSTTQCISRKRCISKFDVESVHPNAVCASTPSLGAPLCGRHDGTPLLLVNGLEHILIGVGSANSKAPRSEKPSEFLRIANFMDWIEKYVASA